MYYYYNFCGTKDLSADFSWIHSPQRLLPPTECQEALITQHMRFSLLPDKAHSYEKRASLSSRHSLNLHEQEEWQLTNLINKYVAKRILIKYNTL